MVSEEVSLTFDLENADAQYISQGEKSSDSLCLKIDIFIVSHLNIHLSTHIHKYSSTLPFHPPPSSNTSHAMDLRIPRPLPKGLSKVPEDDPSQTPQRNQAHIRHDRGNITTLDNPGSDELAEAVSPNILIDRDRNEDRACNRFI